MIGPRLYELGGTYLEVRCCCQPKKLLGWLPVPDHVEARAGVNVKFIIQQAGWRWRLKRPPIADGARVVDVEHLRVEHVTMPIEEWRDDRMVRGALAGECYRFGLAFKSEDTPIEVLRRIPGFVEAR